MDGPQAIALRRRPLSAHRCALSVHDNEAKVILKSHLNPNLIGAVRSDLTPLHTVQWPWKCFLASLGLAFPMERDKWNISGQKLLHCSGTKGQRDKLKILPRDRTGFFSSCPILSQDVPGHNQFFLYSMHYFFLWFPSHATCRLLY